MLLIIAAWLYCFFVSLCIGVGTLKLLSAFVKSDVGGTFGVFYKFWFGFAVIVALLQVLSLFLPMGKWVFLSVSLLSVICAAISFSRTAIENVCKKLITAKGILCTAGVCVLLLLVAYWANKEVMHADTLLYHYNAVKWAKEYPAVPGLVNLHGRLAFNSSFFLFAALTDIGPYADHANNVALSFLMVCCLIHWCFVILRVSEPMSKRIFCMFTFSFLLAHIAYRMDIASLSTDYPMAVFALVFCLVLFDRINNKILLLLPLAGVVFTLKLSGMVTIVIALIALGGYLLQWKYQVRDRVVRKQEIKLVMSSVIFLFVLVAGFIARNIIQSGWLLYPFPIGNLHLSWSSPTPYVQDMIAWIENYPKIPGGTSPQIIKEHNFFYWFQQWYEHFKMRSEFYMLVCSVMVLLWSTLQPRPIVKFFLANINVLLVLLFSVMSIALWFQSAPDLRFGSIYFFILFAASIVLLWKSTRQRAVLRILIIGIFVHRTASEIPAFVFDREPQLFTFALTQQPELVKVVASPADEKPPLMIYMPAAGNQCGNAPLPCTPYAGGLLHTHQLIRQRVPGDLSKGFLPPKK